MAHVSQSLRSRAQSAAEPRLSSWRRLTQIAFVLTLALVACRILMPESIRSPLDPLAGLATARQPSPAQASAALTQAPASPGPATGLALDLLFCLPAILVLVRRAFDADYRLVHAWSVLPMAALGILAAISTSWAADKFASVVSATHLVCALVCLWSTSQLVRSWLDLRLIAGLCVGLLMALCISGFNFRLIELRDLRDAWNKQKDEILTQHNFKPGSFEAGMFENRVLKGQPMGFSTSTNTYAALLVLTGIIAAGVVVQHAADRDRFGWFVAPVVALFAVPQLISWTGCRAAYATPIIALLMFLAIFLLRPLLSRFSRALFAIGVGAIAAIAGFVIHHGMKTGALWHDSLTFRWRYWIGSARILTAGTYRSPPEVFTYYLGVGWENFGPCYLAHRLAIASEEIRDPHNFIVRAFVELGLVGGSVLLAWMLWLWWDLTRPFAPVDGSLTPEPNAPPANSTPVLIYESHFRPRPGVAFTGPAMSLLPVVAIALIAILANIAASIDFNSDGWYVILELIRRGLFFAVLIVGMSVAALRAGKNDTTDELARQIRVTLDERPAPWLIYAILIALATFLVHNLIEFSLFEPGPMFLFTFLAGAALGERGQGRRQMGGQTRPEKPAGRIVPAVGLAVAGVAWLAALFLVAVPIAGAETLAQDADNNAYAFAASHNVEALQRAINLMTEAHRDVPMNADYSRRAAEMMLSSGAADKDPQPAKKMLDAAVAADPSSVKSLLLRARFEVSQFHDPQAGITDYRRALSLDPNNVRLRIEFARQLGRLSQLLKRPQLAGDAAFEFYRALDYNEQLAPDEVKRLSPDERGEVDRAMKDLEETHADGKH